MGAYTEAQERSDTSFLLGARYVRDLAVDALPEILDAHQPSDDWCCKCGEDCFGGSARYSWQLYLSHVAGVLHAKIVR